MIESLRRLLAEEGCDDLLQFALCEEVMSPERREQLLEERGNIVAQINAAEARRRKVSDRISSLERIVSRLKLRGNDPESRLLIFALSVLVVWMRRVREDMKPHELYCAKMKVSEDLAIGEALAGLIQGWRYDEEGSGR